MSIENINEWKLERYLLRELVDEEMEAIRLRLEIDGELRQRLEHFRQSNQEVLQRYPARAIAATIGQRLGDCATKENHQSWSHRRMARLAYVPLAAAIVAAVLLFLFRPFSSSDIPFPAGANLRGDRIKGVGAADIHVPRLHVFRKSGTAVEELKNGARAESGDWLQLAYTAGPSDYGMIFSIDGKGKVTLHFPDEPTRNGRLQQNRLVFLEQSYELDDAPGFERFFFVHSSRRIDVQGVLKEAGDLAANFQHARTARLNFSESQATFLVCKGE